MNTTLCERLKEKRKKAGLRQIDMAKMLKIDQSTYAGYETGKSEPKSEILIKIADIYETSIDYLMGRYN